MDKLLTILIPTYQNPQQLQTTINSLFIHTEFPYKVIILNNDGSTQGEEELKQLEDWPGGTVSVRNMGSNLGWMGALNKGLEDVDTPFVCLLNDDVVFIPGQKEFFRILTGHFNNPQVGAVGPCSNFVMGGQNMFHLNIPIAFESTLLIGFCVIMRTEAIKKIGGLDEQLPGGDDFDWSIRLRDEGYKLIVDRSAFLYHIGQQTGQRVEAGNWNSPEYKEKVDNAIIRKHGVKKWYSCISAQWAPLYNIQRGGGEEDAWKDEFLKEFEGKKGANLGCGDNYIDGLVNIDQRSDEETGAGS